MMEVFDRIYRKNGWGFGSGHGSLASVTETYRTFLEEFICENHVRSVVDLGCGDWQFSRLVNWGDALYLGLDIVPGLIEANSAKYGATTIAFRLINTGANDIPGGDLLIVKDVLQHFAHADIERFIEVVLPKFKFALITNCILPAKSVNCPIETGGFRPLDLREEPFNLQAAVVHSFTGPEVLSNDTRTTYPAWKKLVLLVHQKSGQTGR